MSDRIDAFATATDMLAALRVRRVSAVELLDLHRRRIERHNAELNAIVEPDFERARRDAEAADARWARGEDAPLLGLPMTLKESVNVRGLRTTAGMSQWKDFRSEHDAPVTTRVKGAGALVMAKTNVPQMLADWQSVNPVYGRTNNPWDLGRTPGGSTGGGAAAQRAVPDATDAKRCGGDGRAGADGTLRRRSRGGSRRRSRARGRRGRRVDDRAARRAPRPAGGLPRRGAAG